MTSNFFENSPCGPHRKRKKLQASGCKQKGPTIVQRFIFLVCCCQIGLSQQVYSCRCLQLHEREEVCFVRYVKRHETLFSVPRTHRKRQHKCITKITLNAFSMTSVNRRASSRSCGMVPCAAVVVVIEVAAVDNDRQGPPRLPKTPIVLSKFRYCRSRLRQPTRR